MPLNFTNTRAIHRFGNWQGAYPLRSTKASRVTIKPSRLIGAADPLYSQFLRANVFPEAEIFGRAIVNKPGVYPYGSVTGTTPVTSTSLKAGTYKSAKIKGKGVSKRKAAALWGRYVPCDGITNAASTSIDTGLYAVDNMEMCVRFKAITGSFYLLQARQTGTATIYGLSGGQSGNTLTSFGITSGINRTSGHIYTIKMTMVNRAVTLYVKDENTGAEDTKTGTAQASTYTFPSPTTIKLFGDASKVDSGVTVYRAYIKVNGEMKWDMYPAIDVVDSNKTVAYDDVAHAASEKLSGSFTGGSLIQPISYAESDGTAWADTSVTPNTLTDRIVADVQFLGEATSYRLYGRRQSANGLGFGINDNNKFMASAHGDVATNVSHTTDERNVYEVDAKNSTFKVYRGNDVIATASITCASSTITQTETIFALAASSGGVTYNSNSRCYSYKHYNGDGVLLRDYLPVRIGTTVELLDLVNWNYATRTGTFTAGADVPYTELCPDIIETNVGDALYGEYGDNLVSFTRKDAIHLDANFTNGKIAANNDRTALFIPVTGGKTYSFLVSDTLKTAGWYLTQIIADVPEIGTDYSIDGVSTFVNRKGYSGYTMTTDSRTKWIGISISESKASTPTFFNQQFMMVEGATVPTAIVPRMSGLHPSGSQTATVGDQTRTITTFLPSANSFVDAQKASNNVECDWKFYVMTGLENWSSQQGTISFYSITKSSIGTGSTVLPSGSTNMLCTHYDVKASGTEGAIAVGGTYINFGVTTMFNTIELWKAHLAERLAKGDPYIIAIPLETPEVTTVTLSEFTQPLGTVTILNQFADGTKGAVDFYGVNIQVNTPVPKPDEPIPLLSNAGEVKVGYIQTQGKIVYDGSSDEVWTYDSGFQRFYLGSASLPSDMKLGGTRTQQMFAPNWRCLWHGEAVSTAVNGDFYVGSNNVFFHSPEGSVADFKAMLQTNPIELYYQRTDDPSFIQPTNGFFGDGQQTVKMESVNLFNKDTSTYHMYYDASGVWRTATSVSSSDFIEVKPNTTYVLSGVSSISSITRRINLFDANKNWISQPSTKTSYPLTVTTTAETKYIRFSYGDYDSGIDADIQFEEGSTKTAYSPYVAPQTRTTSEILPSATSKLNMQGGSDNKDCDRAFIQLDGTENWTLQQGTNYYRYGATIVQDAVTPTTNLVCTHGVGGVGKAQWRIASGILMRYDNASDPDFENVTAFKAWLASEKAAGRPVTIAYPVATSVKSTVQTTPFDIPKKTTYVLSSQAVDGQALDVQAMCVSE